MIDIHSHVLPGVDDGAGTMEEAIEMLRIYASQGVSEIICTPHYKKHHKNPSRETLMERMQALQTAAFVEGMDITLYLGNEVLYFDEIEEDLERKAICTMNDTSYVLVEFSVADSYSYIRNGLDRLIGLGYHPILAHVERYMNITKDWTRVEELHALGVEIQVNGEAILGHLGFGIKRFLKKLLQNELVDYVATDAHRAGKHRGPELMKVRKKLMNKLGKEMAGDLLERNARARLLEQ